ncbi:MAG: putative fosmidomycin resistance protein [Sedimentibacter sp.]|jgi:FSR family fosmidomycin resistance protein-like MFS transporter|nr:putative fosmidomycin resistance protein [Sedimentibacter sp.]
MEKIKLQKSTSYFTKLISVSVGHFLNDFYMNLVPPILFLFVYSLNLTLSQQAFIAFVITSSGSFAQPVIGYFVDKRGKPYLLIFSLIWISFWMSVSGIVTNYYLLVAVVGLGALASALFHPLGSAVAVKLANKSRGTSLSVFMTIGGFAASVSPMVAIPAVKEYGLNVLVFFMIPGIVAALGMYFSQIHKVEINSHEQSDNVEVHDKLNIVTAKWISVLVFISSSKVLIRSFLITFGVQIMLLKQVDVKTAGVVLSVYLLANSLGTILGGLLNDRIGSKKVLLLFNLAAFLCMGAILFTGRISMIMGFLLMGLALSGSNTSNIVMAYELLPKNLNVATGLIMGLSGGLGGLAMLLFGKIADIKGLIAGTSYLMIPLLMTVIITAFLPGEIKKPLA